MAIQAIERRRVSFRWATIFAASLLIAGCNRMEDTTQNLTRAIDSYYNTHPSCLWPEAMKFPVEQDTSNPKETKRLDALVYQGLLARAASPKVMVSAGQPSDIYNLTPKGQSAWTPDPKQPGFGNLCYGHRTVTSIDSSSPTSNKDGATTDVVYRYSIAAPAAWAADPETQAAFPALQADLSGNQVARATLTDTHKGWQVTSAPWAHISDSDIYK